MNMRSDLQRCKSQFEPTEGQKVDVAAFWFPRTSGTLSDFSAGVKTWTLKGFPALQTNADGPRC